MYFCMGVWIAICENNSVKIICMWLCDGQVSICVYGNLPYTLVNEPAVHDFVRKDVHSLICDDV